MALNLINLIKNILKRSVFVRWNELIGWSVYGAFFYFVRRQEQSWLSYQIITL
jgi:hypothetical protein